MKQFLIFVIIVSLFGVSLAERARYDNYRIYKVSVENKDQLAVMKMIEENPDGVSITSKSEY